MLKRRAPVGLTLVLLVVGIGAPVAGGHAAHAARAARPSDLLPKPKVCGVTGADPSNCILRSVLGTLVVKPHIVRPGGIVRARITHYGCRALGTSGPCQIAWQQTFDGRCTPDVTCTVDDWMKQITRCGKFDLTCSWRVDPKATTTRYGVIGLSIGRAPAGDGGEPISAVITNYVGILGAKPPPPLPKQPTGPPQGPPGNPQPPVPPPK